jgi:outer membrane receptor protein involved in Fe transport
MTTTLRDSIRSCLRGRPLALGATALLTAYAGTALAEGAAAAPAAAEVGGLETIVVTARKRTESAQDVPVTVAAISGEEVRKQDLTSLEKIAAATPDFTIGHLSNGSSAQMTLRGIGSSATSIGIEQSVAVVVDGVYYGQGRIIEEGFFDLAQLEILKGPQALFFGKNATAGVVSLTTADPGKESEIRTRASWEFESKKATAEAIVSGPITDTLGARIALRGSHMSGGLYDNVANVTTYSTIDIATGNTNQHLAGPASSPAPGEQEFVGRGTLKWTPSDDLTGTLKFSTDWKDVNNSSWNVVPFRCPTGFTALGSTKYACGENFVTHQNNIPLDIAAVLPYSRDDGRLYNRYQSYAATGTLNWKLNGFTLTSVSNWNRNNNRWACACDYQSSNTPTWATENSTWWAYSEELRLLSTFDSPLNFMLGGLYQKTNRKFGQWIVFAGLEDSSQSPENRYQATSKTSETDGKTVSIFGQLIWKITPQIEATAGARYTDEKKDSIFAQPYNIAPLTFIFRPADATPYGTVVANQKFKNWSPEVTLSWKPQDGLMFYGAFKSGYKSGGFDNGGINSAALAANPVTYMAFNPEKARGFEVGVKSTLMDNQLRANFTVYNYKFTDLQVQFFNSPIFAFQTVSADARTRGAELNLEYAPKSVKGLQLHATITSNDAKYTRFIAPCYAGETPDAGCNIGLGNPGSLPFQDLTGKRLGIAPKVTGAVGGRYEWALGPSGMHLDLAIDARYSDKYLASSFNNPLSEVGSYLNLDAGLRLVTGDEKYEFALLGKNLSNKFWVGGVVDGPSTGSGTGTPAGIPADQMGFGNSPRTVVFEASAKF